MTDDPSALFRRAAALATEYRSGIAEAPQRPRHRYAESLADWEAPTPEDGTPAGEVLEELVRRAEPGLHAMTGPRFFGWVIGGSHPAGVAADWLVSAWGQNVGNHAATPAAAAAEVIASRWLVDMLGRLTPRERLVVERRVLGGYLLREIAVTLNVSREYVRQLEAKALKKLRRAIEAV